MLLSCRRDAFMCLTDERTVREELPVGVALITPL